MTSEQRVKPLWTASELRHECELFVDRLVPLVVPAHRFENVVDEVFNAMKFLLDQPR
jgi:hypothetical protein